MSVSRVRCDIQGISPVYSHVEESGEDFMSFFKKNLRIHITRETPDEIEFDMVGIDAPLANALRRILLAEVPSVAIEDVFITMNSSIIQDEVLAHRLGLIPLKIDAKKLDMIEPGDEFTDLNTVVLTLKARGVPQPRTASELAALEGEEDADARFTKVYSSALQWEPAGGQAERFEVPVRPVHEDILIAKLAPEQEIDVELHARKGVGKDHAKYSPVATAAYRLLPAITMTEPDYFNGEAADRLVASCPLKVFDIEELGGGSAAGSSSKRKGSAASASGPERRAVVARPRDCTVCRECIRDPEAEKRLKIERVMDHFIFSVESTGVAPARELVKEALGVLKSKVQHIAVKLEEAALPNAEGQPIGALPPAAVARATIATMKTDPDDLA